MLEKLESIIKGSKTLIRSVKKPFTVTLAGLVLLVTIGCKTQPVLDNGHLHNKAKQHVINYVNNNRVYNEDDIEVYQYPEVLKNGDSVQPHHLIPDGVIKKIKRPTYFFVIDLYGGPIPSMFAHAVEYVFLNQRTFELEKQNAMWQPKINNKPWPLPKKDKIYEKITEETKKILEEENIKQ